MGFSFCEEKPTPWVILSRGLLLRQSEVRLRRLDHFGHGVGSTKIRTALSLRSLLIHALSSWSQVFRCVPFSLSGVARRAMRLWTPVPLRAGVAARSIKSSEATLAAQTGW